MLNLTKRVNKLLERTSSLECKNVCKEILETYTSIPEEQLAVAIVEKLKGIQDADKHVKGFVQTSEKYLGIKSLGLSKAISEIRESQAYHYPALRYTLDKFERAIIEGSADYLLAEDFMKSMRDFGWEKNVKDHLILIGEKYEAQKEAILVAKAVFELKKAKGNFIFEKVVDKLEEHFETPTQASRSALIEDLSKFAFNQTAKVLLENLRRIQSQNGSLQVISENSNCEVSNVYSPLILENGNEYFVVKSDVYKKNGSVVEKVSVEELSSLSENVRRSHQVINSPYFFVKEGRVSFFLGRNKVEIFEKESAKTVLFNGKNVPASDIARNLVATGMVRLEEARVASDVQFITDIFENFFEMDFAKVISSRRYSGSYVTLMKVEDKIYLNKVNESMKSNEFYTDINATQARNIVLEFLGYDIAESLEEYIEKDQAQILEIKSKQSHILKSMAVVESEITKIEGAKKDPYLANNPQLKQLEEMLRTEIDSLKSKYQVLSAELRKFEAKSSDAGVEIGEDVKLENGELATVQSIDSTNKTVTVITATGKTMDLPVNKVTSVEAEEAKAMERNEEKGEAEGEKIAEEELSAMAIASGNDIPVSDPNKDALQSQQPTVTVTDESPEYVTAVVAEDQGGTCAGKEVKVLAIDFTSKGPEDLIQAECDGDLYFIEKKFLQVPTTEGDDSLTIDFDAEAPSDEEEKKDSEKKEDTEETSDDTEEKKEDTTDSEGSSDSEENKEETEETSDDSEKKEDTEETSDEKSEDGEEKKEDEESKPSVEDLQAKLAKALKELESIRDEMASTFSKNENVSQTILGLRGVMDAMKSDTDSLK
jgi:hypothetical protein